MIERSKINFNPAREPNETFEDYAIRRKIMKKMTYPVIKPPKKKVPNPNASIHKSLK